MRVGSWCAKVKIIGILVIFLAGSAIAKERFNNDEAMSRNMVCDISRTESIQNRKARLMGETVANVRQISKWKFESMKRSTTSVKDKMEFSQRFLVPRDLCRTTLEIWGGKYSDGFAKLATLDKNGDDQLQEKELTGRAIWTDNNSNTQVE